MEKIEFNGTSLCIVLSGKRTLYSGTFILDVMLDDAYVQAKEFAIAVDRNDEYFIEELQLAIFHAEAYNRLDMANIVYVVDKDKGTRHFIK